MLKEGITVTQNAITAKDVVKNYIAAIGGEQVLKNIKDIKLVRSAVVQQVPIVITETKKTPDMLKISIDGMNMTLQKVVLSKGKGYQENRGQRVDLSQQEAIGTAAEADLLSKLTPEKYGIKQDLKGIEIVDSTTAYVIIETDPTGRIVQYYYDASTWLLFRKIGNEKTPQGIMVTLTTYSDYREIPGSGGYRVPHQVKQEVGNSIVNSIMQSVEVNKNIPDSEFQ